MAVAAALALAMALVWGPAAGAARAAPVGTAVLKKGATGTEVAALQNELVGLGYWLGEADGVFDEDTRHAVIAFQKLSGLARDGVVGPATRSVLDAAARPAARTTAGHVIEIDLAHQVLLIVDDGTVSEAVDVSTGRRAGTTPAGTFTVERQIDGLRRAPLGRLYRPKYIHGGVAVHGFTSVPTRPASHGCVRVTYTAMDHLWGPGVMPLGTPVVVY
ncbi:MAG: L,D-transpeptidase family protein [Acidimicrobiia bacterium]|nr:L,D-transpeptidase family protein [Acidimicrobiia bacterium]MDH5291962.1 L,D-transpeptidase family protein [Acidimicrobiia bacterium]